MQRKLFNNNTLTREIDRKLRGGAANWGPMSPSGGTLRLKGLSLGASLFTRSPSLRMGGDVKMTKQAPSFGQSMANRTQGASDAIRTIGSVRRRR